MARPSLFDNFPVLSWTSTETKTVNIDCEVNSFNLHMQVIAGPVFAQDSSDGDETTSGIKFDTGAEFDFGGHVNGKDLHLYAESGAEVRLARIYI